MRSPFIFEESEFEIYEERDQGEVDRNSAQYTRWLQQALNRVSGAQLSVNGAMGLRTRKALRAFQRREGLPADGVTTSQTEQKLIARGAPSPVANEYEFYGNFPHTFDEFEFEASPLAEEFSLSSFPSSVIAALGRGLTSVALKLAIAFGNRDENKLTNMIFFARHPERGGARLLPSEPQFKQLSQEWIDIRNQLVRPALRATPQTPAKPSPQTPTTPATPTPAPSGNLKWGVPDGAMGDPFFRDREDYRRLKGGNPSRSSHVGIDVSQRRGAKAGAPDDPRRGVPVYATIKTEIPIAELNNARMIEKNGQQRTGLGIKGTGVATLKHALVLVQPWEPKKGKPENVINSWGGIVGLACRYSYQRTDGSTGTFTIYVEYLHLISNDYPPIDNRGNKMYSIEQWAAMGKGAGFGPLMKNRTLLSPSEFSGNNPPLVGYLGATVSPHVHINAAFKDGEAGYIYFPRLDPTVVIY